VPVYSTILLIKSLFDYIDFCWQPAEALELARDYFNNITILKSNETKLGMKVLEDLKISSNGPAQMKPLEHPYYWGAWVCQGVNE